MAASNGLDIAAKIIKVRTGREIAPDHLGAVELDRLYRGGFGLGSSDPHGMNVRTASSGRALAF